MRIGFVTCVQLGLSCMETICAAGFRLDLAITIPDDRARAKSGRVYLDEFCRRHCVPLLKVNHINDGAAVAAIRAHQIDWLLIIGWSQIAGVEVLSAPKSGVLGIHPTLLPIGRGRAAIPWAILKRLPETGVTLFQLSDGVDTGPIVAQLRIPLGPSADATWLYDRVNAAHVELIRSVLPQLAAGTLRPRSQDESRATTWPARQPEDGRIDLDGSVEDAECLVRAVTRPYPGAFVDRDGFRLLIWNARVVREPSPGLCVKFRDGILQCTEYNRIPL